MRNPIILIVLLWAGCGLPSAGALDVQVIVNPSVNLTTISAADLEDFYLGKKRNWSNGMRALVLTSADTTEEESFLAHFLALTPASFSAAWKRIIFTGKGSPLSEAKDDQEMLELVRKNPGAIGYVRGDSTLTGVTVLSVGK